MSRYAFEPTRRELLVSWGTGTGDQATVVAGAGETIDTDAMLRLARQLSAAAWRTYTHPASAAADHRPNSEGWRRDEERKSFAAVAAAFASPELPDEDGSLIVSYSPIEESAHQVGRILHHIANPALTAAVVTDAAAELEAVESAERGDLTGRARQAVLLSREDASPLQVAAADRLLHQDPFGTPELFTDIEPTAAAVATAHWLAAAAEVTSDVCDIPFTRVVLTADDIEALPHESPTHILELIEAGHTPREAVTTLIRGALRLADGLIPDYDTLLNQITTTEATAAQYATQDPTLGPALRAELRLTTLDPTRAAPDLLEDLIEGIRACWLLWSEETDGYDDQDEFAALVRTVADDEAERLA